MKVDKKTENEIKTALQTLTETYSKRDLLGFLGCFSPDADVILYGTGADEKRVGQDEIQTQVQRDWSQTDSASMSFTWTAISGAGPVVWVAMDGEFKFRSDGEEKSLPTRTTLVFENRGGEWLIVQSHFSVPASGQEQGQSF